MCKLWTAFVFAATVAGCGGRIGPLLPSAPEQSSLPAMRPSSFWKFSSFGRGFKYPLAVAAGPNGSVYVADAGHFVVKKVAKSGKITVVIHSDQLTGYYPTLNSIADDAVGDIFLTDEGFVFRFTLHGKQKQFPYPYNYAAGVAVNYNSGSAYVADGYHNEVLRYDPPYVYGESKVVETASGIRQVSVGKYGELYVLEDCSVFKMSASGQNKKRVDRSLKCPDAIAADKSGWLFAIDEQGAKVFAVSPSGNTSTIGDGFAARAIAVDAERNVYLAEPDRNAVVKLIHP